MNRVAWVLAGLFVVLVVVLIFLLGSAEEGGDTTVAAGGTTTTSGSETTISTEPATTTTTAETTSTVEETTTTEGTTTTSLLEGNWADLPLVVWRDGALGWWDGARWVQVEEDTALSVSGGEDYQVAYLGVEAVTTGGPPTTLCEPLQVTGVQLDDPALLGEFPVFGVAVSAPWALTPHLVEEAEDNGTYAAFAGELLAERGMFVAEPVIKQLIRTDLEGDGINEVIVVAEDVAPNLLAESGNYSIAFVRKAIEGDVQTAILGESIVTELEEGATPFILSFAVGAVADLNGDGKMEIVISAAYYEGAGVEVWEYVDDDLGPAPRISAGCGV